MRMRRHKCTCFLLAIGADLEIVSTFNPLVPDAYYSERQDKPFSLQIERLEFDLKLNCGFLFFAPRALMGQLELFRNAQVCSWSARGSTSTCRTSGSRSCRPSSTSSTRSSTTRPSGSLPTRSPGTSASTPERSGWTSSHLMVQSWTSLRLFY